MSHFAIFSSIDPNTFGKVDKSSFSQQTLMELFIEGIEHKHVIWGTNEDPNDISEWPLLTFNGNSEVVKISWGFVALKGTLSIQWLPSTTQRLDISDNCLTREIDFTSLPDALVDLNLSSNQFIGEIDLCHLPEKLENLNLAHNNFTGWVKLSTLPEKMEVLNLSWNQLSGNIDVTSLPLCMKQLFLNETNLSGETDFSKLPKSLMTLDVSKTELWGDESVIRARNFDSRDSKVGIHRAECDVVSAESTGSTGSCDLK